jgi:hypothetical protein
MTHIKSATTATERELIVHPYNSENEEDEGTRMVYIEIIDRTNETLANVNVNHSELLKAIGPIDRSRILTAVMAHHSGWSTYETTRETDFIISLIEGAS